MPGKPAQVLSKIVDGKVAKWTKEVRGWFVSWLLCGCRCRHSTCIHGGGGLDWDCFLILVGCLCEILSSRRTCFPALLPVRLHASCMQSCLLEQKFVLDDSLTVRQLLKQKGQELGMPGKMLRCDWLDSS